MTASTDLALQTLRDHPEGIRSVVLDSMVPPQANTAVSGLTAMFDACAAQPACREAHPTLRDDFFRLARDLTTTPRTVTVENLARGDGSVLAAALLAGAPPSGVTGYGLALGVFCSEAAATIDRADIIAAGRPVLPDLPDAVLGLLPQAPYLLGDCRSWDVPAAPERVAEPATGDTPVLILDGGLDAITAPRNGELVARSLPKATRLLFPDSAHDVVLWPTPCALPVMQSFLDGLSAPDTQCLTTVAPAAFAL
jgi:pimeloyl-ACP methyl ester carboxylesterase